MFSLVCLIVTVLFTVTCQLATAEIFRPKTLEEECAYVCIVARNIMMKEVM